MDAIVHLGGVSVEGPFQPILQAHVLGVYNLYEAARKHDVKRVVLASSNHVTGFYRQSETITAKEPARPDGLYGVSKAFGEDLSRFYFDRYGQAGMVMVNLPTAGVDYHVPFGGRKGSSYGSREQGRYAQAFFTIVKTAYTLS